MNESVEMWTAINTIGLAVVAVAGVINHLLTRRKVQDKVQEVQKEVQEVKKIVDGPLSVALKSNAELAKRIADITGDHSDVKAAIEAEAVNKNREEGKEIK